MIGLNWIEFFGRQSVNERKSIISVRHLYRPSLFLVEISNALLRQSTWMDVALLVPLFLPLLVITLFTVFCIKHAQFWRSRKFLQNFISISKLSHRLILIRSIIDVVYVYKRNRECVELPRRCVCWNDVTCTPNTRHKNSKNHKNVYIVVVVVIVIV